MRWTIFTPALATAAVVLAAPATAAVGDFRLPSGSQAQPEPDRQGPVVPDVPESRRPAPTPTPSASAPAPTPAPSPTAVVTAAPTTTEPRPTATRTVRAPVSSPAPNLAAPLPPVADVPTASPTSNASGALPPPSAVASPTVASAPAEPDEGSSWPWILGGLAALGLLGGAGFVWWRWRQAAVPARVVAQVERPNVAPMPAATRAPVPGPAPVAPTEPLQVTLEPLRLSLTLMNATLAYRLEVANRGPEPIVGLNIGADMNPPVIGAASASSRPPDGDTHHFSAAPDLGHHP